MSRLIDRRAAAIVFALLLGGMAGCGGEEGDGKAEAPAAGEAAAGAQADTEEVAASAESAATDAGDAPAEGEEGGEAETKQPNLKVEKRNFVKLSGKTEWPDPTLQPRNSEIMPLADQANTLSVARSSLGYVAVGERGHILISGDGADWTQVVSPSRSKLNKVWFVTDEHGWAIGNDSTILETKDGGETWELRYFEGASEPLYDIIDLKRDEYMVVGRKGSVLISRDRGRSWERITNEITDFGFHFFSLTRLKDDSLWVTGETGFVVRIPPDGVGLSEDELEAIAEEEEAADEETLAENGEEASEDEDEVTEEKAYEFTGRVDKWQKVVSPYTGSLFGMLPLGRYGFLVHGLRGNVFVVRNHYNLVPEDMDEYDEYDIENIYDEDSLAEIGWEMVDSTTKQSLFGGAITSTGEVFLVGVNGTGVRSSQRVTAFETVDLGLNYSLSDVILLGSRALVVGKNGPAWVMMN